MKIDLEKHDLGPPCKVPEHHVLGLTWRYVSNSQCVRCKLVEAAEYRKCRDESAAAAVAEYQKEYRKANRAKLVERSALRRKANLDREKKRRNTRYAANPGKELAQSAAYRKANPEKLRVLRFRYRKNNPGKLVFHTVKRKAAKLQRTPSWADLKDIAGYYQTANWLEMHVDHIVPLQGKKVSGLHVSNNLRMLTAEENIRKGNRFDPWTHVHEAPPEALEWLAQCRAERMHELLK